VWNWFFSSSGPRDLQLVSVPLNQDDKNMARRQASAGAVIAGAELTIDVLKSILEAIGDVSRKVAIGIENESGHPWEALNAYFFSGTSHASLPYSVSSGEALLYEASKTRLVKGAVGVLTYYIPDMEITLAVLFSIPHDYNLYSNWWNVKLYSGQKRADYNMYYDLYYYANPFEGNNAWHLRDVGSGLKIRGSMAGSGQVTFELHVTK